MGEYRTISSDIWSDLSTVKTIDTDYGISDKDIVPTTVDVCKPTPKSVFIESLIDQLCKLIEKDSHKRRKIYEGICAKLFEMKLIDETYQLEELSSLRGYYQQAMINLLRTPDPSLYGTTSYNLKCSRYLNEYEEISFIAAGGFGKVYKAKHRLDQVFYAVKKINIKFENMSALIMESNEVKTLAKLNHPNIVQYKGAWLEPLFNVSPALPSVETPHCCSSDSDEIVFQGSNSSSSVDNDNISSSKEKDSNLAVCKYIQNNLQNHQRKQAQISAILYVSMQLCDGTLREWLNKRNSSVEVIDLPMCLNIMIEATKGLEYIHSCDIVHHDIKPSNIFLSNNLKSVQVGDFGLSCCLQSRGHSVCPLEGGRFGTPLYAAPEQRRRPCDFKSDMFSLGIVFVELVSSFATEMERVSVLNATRSGSIPQSVPEEFVLVIRKLLSPKADDRPSSTELLKMLCKLVAKPNAVKPSLSFTKPEVMTLNCHTDSARHTEESDHSDTDVSEILKEKDREISELRLMLAKRDREIAQLKKRIVGTGAPRSPASKMCDDENYKDPPPRAYTRIGT